LEGLKEQLACVCSVQFKYIPVNQQKQEPLQTPLLEASNVLQDTQKSGAAAHVPALRLKPVKNEGKKLGGKEHLQSRS